MGILFNTFLDISNSFTSEYIKSIPSIIEINSQSLRKYNCFPLIIGNIVLSNPSFIPNLKFPKPFSKNIFFIAIVEVLKLSILKNIQDIVIKK